MNSDPALMFLDELASFIGERIIAGDSVESPDVQRALHEAHRQEVARALALIKQPKRDDAA